MHATSCWLFSLSSLSVCWISFFFSLGVIEIGMDILVEAENLSFPNEWKINAIQSIFSPFPMIPSSMNCCWWCWYIELVGIRWMVRRFTSLQPYSRFFYIEVVVLLFSSQPHAGDVVPSSLSSFSISLSSLGVVSMWEVGSYSQRKISSITYYILNVWWANK